MMSKEQLIEQMILCWHIMAETAVAMEYYGGLSEVAEHGKELTGAAAIMAEWIEGIKKL